MDSGHSADDRRDAGPPRRAQAAASDRREAPVASSARMMKKPYGSMRASAPRRASGSRLTAMRPPSSGGIGSRLSAISTRLIDDSDVAPSRTARRSATRRRRPSPAEQQRPAAAPCTKFAPGPARRDPEHVALRMAQVAEVDRHRLRPAEEECAATRDVRSSTPGTSNRADRVDVLQRVQRDAAQHLRRCWSPNMPGDVAVRRFVQRDREDHRHRPAARWSRAKTPLAVHFT